MTAPTELPVDFATAMAAGHFFSFETTAAAGTTVSLSGMSGLNLVRTGVGPTTAGLFYSTDGTTYTQTGSTFTVTNIPASAASGSWAVQRAGNDLVLSYTAAGGSGYSTWAAGAPWNLSGGNELPNADPDRDGMDNGIEFVVGGNPSTTNDSAKIPIMTLDGTNEFHLEPAEVTGASRQRGFAQGDLCHEPIRDFSQEDAGEEGSAGGAARREGGIAPRALRRGGRTSWFFWVRPRTAIGEGSLFENDRASR